MKSNLYIEWQCMNSSTHAINPTLSHIHLDKDIQRILWCTLQKLIETTKQTFIRNEDAF